MNQNNYEQLFSLLKQKADMLSQLIEGNQNASFELSMQRFDAAETLLFKNKIIMSGIDTVNDQLQALLLNLPISERNDMEPFLKGKATFSLQYQDLVILSEQINRSFSLLKDSNTELTAELNRYFTATKIKLKNLKKQQKISAYSR